MPAAILAVSLWTIGPWLRCRPCGAGWQGGREPSERQRAGGRRRIPALGRLRLAVATIEHQFPENGWQPGLVVFGFFFFRTGRFFFFFVWGEEKTHRILDEVKILLSFFRSFWGG